MQAAWDALAEETELTGMRRCRQRQCGTCNWHLWTQEEGRTSVYGVPPHNSTGGMHARSGKPAAWIWGAHKYRLAQAFLRRQEKAVRELWRQVVAKLYAGS